MLAGIAYSVQNATGTCSSCYYGSFCQFTTSHYAIMLETVMDMSVAREKIIGGIIAVFLLGLACNMLSVITFFKAAHGRGNRIYRLWISVVGLLGTIVLALRLLLLFTRQTSGIMGCFILDYLVSALTDLYYSLTACVFIEQAVVACRHPHFDNESSRHTATLIIPVLTVYHLVVGLYKPIHRQLLADPYAPTRLWCSFLLRTGAPGDFERTINVLHLVLPLALNLLSPIAMLVVITRDKIVTCENTRMRSIIRQVLNTYHRNVVVPYILVACTLPYVLVTFSLNCVTQSWQNSVYLAAYFVYLTPLLGSFFIFVLTSPTFSDELYRMWQRSFIYARVRQS